MNVPTVELQLKKLQIQRKLQNLFESVSPEHQLSATLNQAMKPLVESEVNFSKFLI